MKKTLLALIMGGLLAGLGLGSGQVTASDHDDGTTDTKTQNTNLTDLYVFTETSQNSSANDGDLIFIMNTNPRSLPRQSYFFNTSARYQFNVTRIDDNDDVPTGKVDAVLRFEFAAPDTNNQQKVTITAIRDGRSKSTTTTTGSASVMTTPLDDAPINNEIELDGETLTVFAGLREDPFFFDVERYFQVRDSAAQGNLGSIGFRAAGEGVDFTAGYNVLSIVVRVPRTFLQSNNDETSFDVWETITVKK